MDVGIYARLSLAKTTAEATDEAVDRQEARCRALADAKGWHVAEVYPDVDVGAYRAPGKRKPPPRPEFERMLHDIEIGRINGVVFAKLDRLVRDHGDFERVLAVCEAHKAVLASVADPLDTSTPHGEAMARMGVTFARLESQTTGQRVAAQREQAARAGRPTPGGWRPYGFEADQVTIREAEAAVLRRVADGLLAGKSLTSVVREVNAAGSRTVTGRPFSTQNLRKYLLAPRLAGLRAYRGEVVADAVWPAIIQRERWEQLVAVLTDPARGHNRPGRPRRWLLVGGMARCGYDDCGAALIVTPDGNGVHAYRCTSAHRTPGSRGCGRISVRARPLEALVAELVFARDWRHLDVQAARATDETGLAAEQAAAKARLVEVGRLHARGRIGIEEWLAQRDEIAVQVAELQDRLDDARRAAATADAPQSSEELRAWWEDDDTTLEQKRAVLDRMLVAVIIRPAGRRHGRTSMDPDRVDPIWRA